MIKVTTSIALLPLLVSPSWAQTKLTPNNPVAQRDSCSPIGRTEDGKLVYSIKCDRLPTPPSQAQINAPPPAPKAEEPETVRSGIFGLSYERR